MYIVERVENTSSFGYLDDENGKVYFEQVGETTLLGVYRSKRAARERIDCDARVGTRGLNAHLRRDTCPGSTWLAVTPEGLASMQEQGDTFLLPRVYYVVRERTVE